MATRQQINDIRLAGMPNGTHYDFMEQTYTWILQSPLADKIKDDITAFKKALDEEDRCLKISQKSALTKTIEEQDKIRDTAYSGLKGAVSSYQKFPSGELKDAADTIAQLFVDYQISTDMQLNRETGLITNLLQDLEGKCATQVEKLSLKPFVDQLKTANDQVKTLMAQRDTDRGEIVAGEMKAARAATDNAYRELVTKANAYAVIEGDTDYAAFFKQMNSMISRYKVQVLGQKSSSTTDDGSSSSSDGGSTSTDNNGSSSDGGSSSDNDGSSSGDGGSSSDDGGSSSSGDTGDSGLSNG